MKKTISLMMIIMMLLGLFSFSVNADKKDEYIHVYVSITDGENKLAYYKVKVFDKLETDGKYTLREALYYTHVWCYEGGATAGFSSAKTEYGTSLTKLWGKEGGFGYYINDLSAMNLDAEVKEGDHIHAFVYTDTEGWSDTYAFFDKLSLRAENDETVSFTLKAMVYDADWNQVSVPVKDAVITLNGEKTEFRTDEEGKVSVTFTEGGRTVVGAYSESMTLVSPVSVVRVEGGFTALGFVILLITLAVGLSAFGAWYFIVKKKKG